jgi:thiol-disulfide isomerase/thioredoxin
VLIDGGFDVSEPTISCPSCKSEIRLTESLAAPLLEQTKAEFRRQLSAKDVEITRREEAITKTAAELEEQRTAIETPIAARLDLERGRIVNLQVHKRLIPSDRKGLLPRPRCGNAEECTHLLELIEATAPLHFNGLKALSAT